VNDQVPGSLCNQDGGRCVPKAVAEVLFGFGPNELWPACDSFLLPGESCTAGWKPGGAYTFQQVISIADSCGNDICDNGEYPGACPEDCYCGDGVCSPSEIGNCNEDCGQCGDGNCDSWETPKNCPADCSVICGDGSCDSSEVSSCPNDCACQDSPTNADFPSVCGDGFCHGGLNSPENCITCPKDCDGTDCDGDNFCRCEGENCGNIDCNDADNQIYPGATETCDGIDNDCDQAIDEDFADLGNSCTVGIGECQNTGTLICTADGSGTGCNVSPGEPSNEICDGLDNNCDGQIDNEGYSFGGFLQPINPDGSSIFKAGRTIPVKVKLSDCDGGSISTAVLNIKFEKISSSIQGSVEEIEVEASGKSNSGTLFRYDFIAEQYVYNLSTKDQPQGTYKVSSELDNGDSYSVEFSLR
jgi:hypothetical protein